MPAPCAFQVPRRINALQSLRTIAILSDGGIGRLGGLGNLAGLSRLEELHILSFGGVKELPSGPPTVTSLGLVCHTDPGLTGSLAGFSRLRNLYLSLEGGCGRLPEGLRAISALTALQIQARAWDCYDHDVEAEPLATEDADWLWEEFGFDVGSDACHDNKLYRIA